MDRLRVAIEGPNVTDVIRSAEQDEEGAQRLAEYLRVYDRLRQLSPKHLVDLALEHMSKHVSDKHYEQIIEELCTRVWPNWPNEGD